MDPLYPSLDTKHIVVVDDDDRIRQLLGKFLKEQGFLVSLAKDAQETFRILEDTHADMLILDVMLPGKSGMDILRMLRQSSKVPIMMLTAISEMSQKLEGLGAGADDYLTKPFDPSELILRIRNILHRAPIHPQSPLAFDKVGWDDMIFSIASQQLIQGNVSILLTKTEASLLSILAENAGLVVSRQKLSVQLGGVNARTLDVQITRLRQKIEKNPKAPTTLKTIRNKGYILYAHPFST